MAGLRAAWEMEHGAGSVTGLAPSAAAAEVLGDDMGIDTDNLAKWLHEHRQHGQRVRELGELREKVRLIERSGRVPSPRLHASITRREEALARWTLRAGQLVVVDEASLASTFALDELTVGRSRRAGQGRPRRRLGPTLQCGRRRNVSHPRA